MVGSRGYRRLDLVRGIVFALPPGTVVVSGGAVGVDSAAEGWALGRGLEVDIKLPNWRVNGRRAGFLRNDEIVAAADRVVAFWDGSSSGTAYTIQKTRLAGKPLKVYGPDGERMRDVETGLRVGEGR